MSRELFLEIGTEEIPAGFIEPALKNLAETARTLLAAARLPHEAIRTYGTPRRLVLVIDGLGVSQQALTEEIWGPSKKAAYDVDGNPTRAFTGFCAGKGVDPKEVSFREKEAGKGEYLYVEKAMESRPAAHVLPDILKTLVEKLPFPKSMRWKDQDVAFARPVHWIIALFGGEVVPFSFGDVASSNKSRGHRFHAPDEFTVASFGDYQKKCEAAKVIIDPERRKAIIREGIAAAAKEAGGKLIEDEGLVDEVANLVEYPVVLSGSFDREYLSLPSEIVINAMREHQRYFSVDDGKGALLPCFITVSNTAAKDMSVVKKGNERVLRARLSDAAFYYYEDLDTPIDHMVEKLKSVVFQVKLGTSFEKMERFRALAGWLADNLAPALKEKVLRAAWLAKGDLVSGVVYEFPKLQGIMGRDYALKGGEDGEVASAIFEHYLPRSAEDILPSSDTGAIVSMADKMDTICGCFGIGLIPTGAADPYALRRQTLGIIRIIMEKDYRISLSGIVERSIEIAGKKLTRSPEEIRTDVLDFFKTRLAGLLASKGHPGDVVDAVLSRGFDDILDAVEIAKALSALKGEPGFEPLAVAFKRVVNITKDFTGKGVDPALFEEGAEGELHRACHAIAGEVMDLAASGRYSEALRKAAEIRPFVDCFFDDILVMAEDERIRNNRLSLLKEVSGLFTRFADFSRIVTETK